MMKRFKFILLVTCCLAVGLVIAPIGSFAASNGPYPPNKHPHKKCTTDTRLVILKAAGGHPLWPANYQKREPGGISSALVVGDDVYLVDICYGSLLKYMQAGLGPVERPLTGLENLRAIFITHFHDDHWMDLPAFISLGVNNGLDNVPPEHLPIPIVGPGNHGTVPYPPLHPEYLGNLIVNSNPMPGIEETFEELISSLRPSLNFLLLSGGHSDPRLVWDPRDIMLPDIPGFDPQPTDYESWCPPMDPFEIYQDENVTVKAILVQHTWPACYGFRFDTADGLSVAFSGDTGPETFGNMQKLAAGADVLVHDAYNTSEASEIFGGQVPFPPFLHTTEKDVGKIAEEAGVSTLVINHMFPPDTPDGLIKGPIKEDFSGRVIVGRDLLEVCVGKKCHKRWRCRPDFH